VVYVDRLVDYGWRLGPSCHLIADTVEELRAFAARLGMRRSWLQTSKSGILHFDLTAARRGRAIRFGAKACETTEDLKAFVAAGRECARRVAETRANEEGGR